jgi:hypothetical protein
MTLSEQVMVYPNPSKGEVTVDFALNNMEPVTIEVTNIVGAKVASYTFNGGFGSQTLDLGKFGVVEHQKSKRNHNQENCNRTIIRE